MSNKAKKGIFLSTWMGIGATWFGVHMGPGTASGKQGATYYAAYGKWGFLTPILAMGLLAFVLYMVIEYSRRNKLTRYKEFFDHFFAPHEKAFSIIFDVLYFFTYFMVVGASLFTGGKILAQQSGLPYIACVLLIAFVSIMLIIYGATLVRNANNVMTWVMLGILLLLLIFALTNPASQFSENWNNNPDVGWRLDKFFPALLSAIVYASFQVTGAVGSVASVTEGLETKNESKKAAIFGWLSNTVLLVMIMFMQFGYLNLTSAEMPNYEILRIVDKPILFWLYVIVVELAVISTVIGMNNGVATRIEKYVKIESPVMRNVVLNVAFLVGAAAVSYFGLTNIVSIGFKYLGYACLPLVIIPIIVIGTKKVLKNKKGLPDTAAAEHLAKTKK